MHDRRIDGKAHTFGNYGALYMNAMTWWDHETDSVWSQPIVAAIKGQYLGVRLEMIPAAVLPWGTWKREHPNTLALEADDRFGVQYNPFEYDLDKYVLGVALGDDAKAYPWNRISARVVSNDTIGDVPVLVYANPEDRSAHVFVRLAEGIEVVFAWVDGDLRDAGTDSLWDPAKGHAVEGPLRGTGLKELPYSTAYDWAWKDFYPETAVFGE